MSLWGEDKRLGFQELQIHFPFFTLVLFRSSPNHSDEDDAMTQGEGMGVVGT